MSPLLTSLIGGLFAALALALIIRTWFFRMISNPDQFDQFVLSYMVTAPPERRAKILSKLNERWCSDCGQEVSDHGDHE